VNYSFLPKEKHYNEYYAKDTSRKIKPIFKAKGMSGKHMTGQVPYGYLWEMKSVGIRLLTMMPPPLYDRFSA
jgi:hypothetical protein